MNKITTIQDLRFEIGRLEELSTKQKDQIKGDAESLKESLHPLNILYGLFTSFSGKKKCTTRFSKEDLIDKFFTIIKHVIFR